MKILVLSFVFTLFGSVTFTYAQRKVRDDKRADEYARRDLVLERDALAQRKQIDGMLPLWSKRKLNVVFRAFLNRLLHDKNSLDLSNLLDEEMRRQFADLSRQQSNILTFYVLTGVIEMIPPHARKNDTSSDKDSLGEMSQMDMLVLQQMMEKKSQLETMISNVMKAGFEGGQAAIQALKAS